jgi:hypothetical protein
MNQEVSAGTENDEELTTEGTETQRFVIVLALDDARTTN